MQKKKEIIKNEVDLQKENQNSLKKSYGGNAKNDAYTRKQKLAACI